MKKFVSSLLLCCVALAAGAQIERPRLVVGLVVDQMRWDYMYYYYDEYGQGGLKRLLGEGFSCENTMITHVPTVTAIGHSSIYTGSVPYFTGIAGNSFMINGRTVSSCDDPAAQGVGTTSPNGKKSPRNLLATTIGDELKHATDFRSKVFGVAIKDRASILPAGHSADAAYWWDSEVGHFVTSDYYMDELPQWVLNFNKKYYTAPKHNLNTSTPGVTFTFAMAEAILENEQLGKDDITDLLAVSISSTDAIAHTYSTRGPENREVFLQFDKDLEHFLNTLDRVVGRGNYLLFLSADHGGAHNPNYMKAHKQPAGGWDAAGARNRMNAAVEAQTGVPQAIKGISDYRIYLNHDKIDSVGADLAKVKQAALGVLKDDPQLVLAVDYDNLEHESIPAFLKERIIAGYHRGRSGDLFVMTHPGLLSFFVKDDYKGTSHSAWNPYDSHIPLLFYGWHVPHGETVAPTRMVDIAPTVCAMLHIQMPNACIGEPISFK